MIWGTTFVAVKNVSSQIDPFLLSILRNGIAVFALLPIIVLTKNSGKLKNKKSIKDGAILGLILSTIYVVQTIGLQFTTSTHSAFITCSAVIMVPLMLVLFGHQKLTAKQLISVIIVGCGMYLLTNSNAKTPFNKGDFITFIGAIICAIQIISAGYYVRKNEFLGLIFYQFLFACLFSVVGLGINLLINQQGLHFEKEAISGVIYLGILGTLFCFFVTVWAQKYVSTVYTAMIFSLEPVFASISSYIYNGEVFSKYEVYGAIGILIGLIIYNIQSKKIEVV